MRESSDDESDASSQRSQAGVCVCVCVRQRRTRVWWGELQATAAAKVRKSEISRRGANLEHTKFMAADKRGEIGPSEVKGRRNPKQSCGANSQHRWKNDGCRACGAEGRWKSGVESGCEESRGQIEGGAREEREERMRA